MHLAPAGACFLLCNDLQDAGSLNVIIFTGANGYETSCLTEIAAVVQHRGPYRLIRDTPKGHWSGRRATDSDSWQPLLWEVWLGSSPSVQIQPEGGGGLENTGGGHRRGWLVSGGKAEGGGGMTVRKEGRAETVESEGAGEGEVAGSGVGY